MVREAYEEAGIVPAQEDLQMVGVIHRYSIHARINFFSLPDYGLAKIERGRDGECHFCKIVVPGWIATQGSFWGNWEMPEMACRTISGIPYFHKELR